MLALIKRRFHAPTYRVNVWNNHVFALFTNLVSRFYCLFEFRNIGAKLYISRNYKNIWNSTKDSVTTGMFVTCRPCGAEPQVKGAQGPAGRPNPMACRPHFESVHAETWRLHSHVSSQEYPMPESRWKLGGVDGQPRGWPLSHPSPPHWLN
jgi:hypothetical protein